VTWASYVGVRRPHWPKRPIHGALAAKPEVEVWRRPVFFDSATPTSYSTLYTLWGLSRTVTAPLGNNFNISPL